LWPQTEENILSRYRPCINTSTLEIPNPELVTRVFQQAKSTDYSDCLARIVGKPRARLVLLFPYSVQDLLSFFYNIMEVSERAPVERLQSDLFEFLRDPTDAGKQRLLVDDAINLGKYGYENHKHFRGSNEYCAEQIRAGKQFGEIAKTICRVMFIPSKDLPQLFTNPGFMMHILMCGLCVPTLIASSPVLGKYNADEATYIEFAGGKLTPKTTLCLKYSDRSRLLAVFGSCDARPDGCNDSTIYELFEDIGGWLAKNQNLERPPPPQVDSRCFRQCDFSINISRIGSSTQTSWRRLSPNANMTKSLLRSTSGWTPTLICFSRWRSHRHRFGK
jgi:hypothetical protein